MTYSAKTVNIKRTPQRSCSACRVKSDKADLIRIVRSPSGKAVIDVMKKLPGRGAYICPDSDCIEKAKKSGCLAHALGAVPDSDFWPELEKCAQNFGANESLKVRSVLGLARKSGNLIIGTDNIERERRKVLVLHASDCSEAVREFARKYDNIQLDISIAELNEIIGTRGGVQVAGLPLASGFAKKLMSLNKMKGETLFE